ncbi:flagellar biosynthetic protein FliR [Tepidibacter formicigenes]|jgi:flagellar biosynthetic protein FliR|uniref:Flagellar biosynthetic protein FliR n=1 Tax=Tepidibacter formicigenes DSM 15518 TaxID=1123349 RepID=A0A1M6JAD8_9FIRM|nr:flagellar biosynthetic protein FliR [Tepidibacter formicigenes]SHJ43633.1 flagellar biosynthetic protein FliR [Tepidibacter formicigenes DSM 15518]
MNEALSQIVTYLNLYMIVLSRCIGLFIASPVFGRKNLPNIFKLGFSMILAYIILPYISASNLSDIPFLQLLFLAIKELIIGLIIGFIAFVIFSIFFLAGSFIDRDLGFSMANVLDPQYGSQVSISGNFIYILSTLIFLILNGHHYLIRGMINSFYLLPVNSLIKVNDNFFILIIKLLDYIFIYSLKIAIPVIISIFLTNLILGVLARTMPQMNVFVVGMPLKIIFGLAIMSITFPYYIPIIKTIFKDMYEFIFQSIKLF